jgi:deoxyadenosine/deoxycytidine kinase|tara:strand:- start:256 stop:894 length:639 start_codon:yes stop_codon:yes gene_type:complete
MKFNFIVIEGNIGSGKTSLSKKIANNFNGKLILEEFADNPFLPKFYKEAERNAFPLELSFMAERFQQLSGEKSKADLFTEFRISDYSFFKSTLFAQNNLKEDELNLFNQLYHIMFSSVRKPDLLVYLHSKVGRLQENIKKRGRDYEQNIKDEYLKNIEDKYFDYLKKQNDFPVLILDVSEVDFIEDEKIYQQIISEIQNFDKSEKLKKLILR